MSGFDSLSRCIGLWAGQDRGRRTADESTVVVRFRNPRGIDLPYLVSMIHDSFMSRANSIVIPGSKLDLAMQLILTPMVLKLIERKRRAS